MPLHRIFRNKSRHLFVASGAIAVLGWLVGLASFAATYTAYLVLSLAAVLGPIGIRMVCGRQNLIQCSLVWGISILAGNQSAMILWKRMHGFGDIWSTEAILVAVIVDVCLVTLGVLIAHFAGQCVR